MKNPPGALLWTFALATLPASWLSIQMALRLQASCSDFEHYPSYGCAKTPENLCWLLALALILTFAWAVDKLIHAKDHADD